MRFLFFIPSRDRATGGISIIFDAIAVLNEAGFAAYALCDDPHFEFVQHVFRVPRLWSKSVRRVGGRLHPKSVVQRLRKRKRGKIKAAPCAQWQPEPNDVVVVPEFSAHWMPRQLPRDVPLILLNQNPFALLRVFSRAGFNAADFAASLSTSKACSAASRMVFNSEPAHLPLFIAEDRYAFQAEKTFQVAYMPRKRRDSAHTLVKALQATPGLDTVPFVPIDGMTASQAAQILRESLFFLSLSKREGFGLPAAEAMATGSVVIGYTGIGGDEFFDVTTGFPVPEENLMQFYDTAVSVIKSYQKDAAPLDQLRQHASATIFQNYPKSAFEDAVLNVFSQFKTSLAL
ncbi:MAG: glycosyltransferase [Pseudomonadota bacterium]